MKPTMLLIMDGFGLAPNNKGNAIYAANTPNLDELLKKCPHAKLNASGRFVGLPDGQMGNSEVGHTNMGAGRVVWQELSKITNEIENGEFFKNEELVEIMNYAKEGHTLHLMGLLSDGGVHSHNTHLYALIKMAADFGVRDVVIHCILDGRDVPPACAEKYIEELQNVCDEYDTGEIGTITGRFYAMDRDKRWDRVEKAYNTFTRGNGIVAASPKLAMEEARKREETDEFVSPTVIAPCDACQTKMLPCQKKKHLVCNGDAVIFFNFRPDRAREITRAFVDPDFDGFKRDAVLKDLHYVCFTTYDVTIPNVKIAFKPQSLKNTLGEYVSSKGLKQLRIAETEKYAHVTFFFNGGLEEPYEGEDRILIASPKVATYDLKPEMSAFEVTESVIPKILEGKTDLIIMNLANCDMVGHTGVFDAAVKAVETVDECVGKIVEAINKVGGKLIITADHGNADVMLDENDGIVTSHSTNPVPVILVGDDRSITDGALCDLAPTLLTLMGLEIPAEMEGHSLIA